MKKILFILLFVCVTPLLAQTYGVWQITKTDAGTLYTYAQNDCDSAEVFTTVGIDAQEAIAYIMNTVDTYGARDTNFAVYRYANALYPYVIYNGSGVDSLSKVYLQGQGLDATWNTIDSLRTAGATPIYTPIAFWSGIPYYTKWRLTWTVANITVSSYDGIFYFELFVPKRRAF